ncbi:TatD family deoxyribonuclease, partial [Candidatus Woesearchaeota archaeon]
MNLIDVHAHLDHAEFSNQLEQLIPRWKELGVKHIITSGVNTTTNRKTLELAKRFDIV